MNENQPLRAIPVDLEMLCAALSDATDEHQYFLDTETGEVILVSDMTDEGEIDAAQPGRYLELPSADSYTGYRDMEDFVASVRSERVQASLAIAIRGRGAFRRFKDALMQYPDERERWFGFQAARLETRARDWLAAHGYEPMPPPT